MEPKQLSLYLMGALYVIAGLYHFYKPGFYMRIMPPYIPFHKEMVFLSGIAEVLLGILLFVPAYTYLAAWGVIALLIAIFPANVYHLTSVSRTNAFYQSDRLEPAWSGRRSDRSTHKQIPIWILYLRLPIQGLLIWWAYWYT